MTVYFTHEFIKIGIFIAASFALSLVLLAAVYLISFTSKVDIEKSSAYECGFQPFSEANYPFEVQFALIAIMFLLFDIEVLYLFPLAQSIVTLNTIELLYLTVFFAIVILSLVFEVSRNVLQFIPAHTKVSSSGASKATQTIYPTKTISSLDNYSSSSFSESHQNILIFNSFFRMVFSLIIRKPYIIIYPIFVTIILLTLRYLRLGNTIEITHYWNISLISNLLLLFFFWPYISIWLRVILWKIMDIRLALWDDFKVTITLMHTYLLQFDPYFYVVSRLHKLAFLWLTFVTYNGLIYSNQNNNKIRILIYKIYLYPFLSTILLWVLCLFELVLTAGNLKYSLYLLFTGIILRIILSSINEFASSIWPYHVCISDYMYQRWDRPRYPTEFWCRFYSSASHTDIRFDISEELQEIINTYILFHQSQRRTIKKSLYRLIENKNLKYKIAKNIRFTYYNWYQIRWTHTEAIQKAVKIWHPMTSLFARNATDYVAAINNHWSHFHIIEQARRAIPYRQIAYQNFALPNNNLSKISKVIEHNLTTNFHPLQLLDIKVTTFHSSIIRNTRHQTRDDIIINTVNSKVQDSRVHGLDQKAISPSQIKDPSSTILSQISVNDYCDVLMKYNLLLQTKNKLSGEEILRLIKVLDQLKDTCDEIGSHQLIWAQSLHLFPDNSIPPLRVPHNFAVHDFKPELREKLRESNIYMHKISNYLYVHKVPCDYNQAVEYMNTDFARKMFEEVEE